MEIRSDRINFLLADLDDDARERVKVSIRSIAREALPRDEDQVPLEEAG